MTTTPTSGAADLPEAPKGTAADGKTELFNFPGHPLMVRAVDFNRLHGQLAALAAGQAVAPAEPPKPPPVSLYREACATGERCLHGCHKTEPCHSATRPAPPAMDGGEDAVDAARWREALMHVGAAHHFGGQHFTLNTLPAPDGSVGANMLKWGVAQHFTKAIDAERAARAAQKEG